MKVTDVVCGMSFPPEKAVAKVEYQGGTYHFCSDACRKQFDANPEQYVRDQQGGE
jgi:Cu+-exporting ATPase